jgi:hypothetical protein
MPELAPPISPAQPGAPNPAAPAIGPATQPQPNHGNLGQAMNDVRNAVKMLEGALQKIPMETPFHEAVFNAAKGLLKHLRPGEGNQGLELQSMLQMAKQQSQGAPLAALLRMGQGGGGGMPPAMQPPAGGAPTGASPMM